MKYSHLKNLEIRKIIECFCLDITSTKTSILTNVNRNMASQLQIRFSLGLSFWRNQPAAGEILGKLSTWPSVW
jgi:hypothetical protein